MLLKASFALGLIALACPAFASDWTEPGGGVFAQIMDQGGGRTTFTLVNIEAVAAPYTLSFYNDNGSPLTLSTTAGTASSFSGTLAPHGSTIIQTNGSASLPLVEGYAVLLTNSTSSIAGSAIFGLPTSNGVMESTCPLDTGTDFEFGVPFDQTTPGTVVGVALANDYGYTPLNLSIVAYDQNGNQILSTTMTMAENTHTAFLLTSEFPSLQNLKGTIWFTGADGQANPAYFNLLGVRATATTYTSIVPVVAAGF